MAAGALGDVRIGVIGAGVMAEAIIAGLLRERTLPAGSVTCSDPVGERLEALAESYGVTGSARNADAIYGARVVVLAVKPQVLGAVTAELRGKLDPSQLVVSIVAGASTRSLGEALSHDRLVRAMPNTPAQVGRGVTVWFPAPATDADDVTRARAILGALGRELQVGNERQVAMATAVSGSGPAYVFLFMEALIDAAVQLGLPRATARELVLETVEGSAAFARMTGEHVAELRNRVTSPGGTTAAALQRFERGAFRGVLGEAVRAAYDRTLALEAESGA